MHKYDIYLLCKPFHLYDDRQVAWQKSYFYKICPMTIQIKTDILAKFCKKLPIAPLITSTNTRSSKDKNFFQILQMCTQQGNVHRNHSLNFYTKLTFMKEHLEKATSNYRYSSRDLQAQKSPAMLSITGLFFSISNDRQIRLIRLTTNQTYDAFRSQHRIHHWQLIPGLFLQHLQALLG